MHTGAKHPEPIKKSEIENKKKQAKIKKVKLYKFLNVRQKSPESSEIQARISKFKFFYIKQFYIMFHLPNSSPRESSALPPCFSIAACSSASRFSSSHRS